MTSDETSADTRLTDAVADVAQRATRPVAAPTTTHCKPTHNESREGC